MKKLISSCFLLVFALLPAMAQEKQDTLSTDSLVKLANQVLEQPVMQNEEGVAADDDAGREQLNDNMARQQFEIDSLRQELEAAKAALHDLDSTRQALQELEAAHQSLQEEHNVLVAHLQRLDTVLYKQCLLYPLERRYNARLVNNAIKSVEEFAAFVPNLSEEFVNLRSTYEPLLNSYAEYNSEVLGFFTRIHGELTESNQEMRRNRALRQVKELSYYTKCYLGKDKPPFQSIVFLDTAIDDFISIVNRNAPDILAELDALIKRITPKS